MATRWTTGIWKSRAVDDLTRHAWGKSKEGNLQLGIVVNVLQPKGTKREGVVYLTFTEDAKAFSIQRLRELGWKGTDLRELTGISRNYVDCDVSYETWDNKERLRLEIVTPAKPQHKNPATSGELDALAINCTDEASRAPEVTRQPPPNSAEAKAPAIAPNLDEEEQHAFSEIANESA